MLDKCLRLSQYMGEIMQIYQKQLATNSLASWQFYSDLFAEGITCSWSGAPTAYEDSSKSLTMAFLENGHFRFAIQ